MEMIFAVGDIHGCAGRLTALLHRMPVNWERDRLVFLGDYVDRGPDSRRVIEILLDLRRRHGDRTVFLQGNHELMFLNHLRGENDFGFLSNGGKETLESYARDGGDPVVPEDHRDFLANLFLYHETEKYIFVHAGLRPGVALGEQTPEDMLWIRSPFLRSAYDWGKRVVFGHTPFGIPLIEPNKIGIDTGAVYGGRLTALMLPGLEFIFA